MTELTDLNRKAIPVGSVERPIRSGTKFFCAHEPCGCKLNGVMRTYGSAGTPGPLERRDFANVRTATMIGVALQHLYLDSIFVTETDDQEHFAELRCEACGNHTRRP